MEELGRGRKRKSTLKSRNLDVVEDSKRKVQNIGTAMGSTGNGKRTGTGSKRGERRRVRSQIQQKRTQGQMTIMKFGWNLVTAEEYEEANKSISKRIKDKNYTHKLNNKNVSINDMTIR